MIKFYNIDYNDLLNAYDDFMQYALEQSDLCSVITLLKRGSKNTTRTIHDNKLQVLNPFLYTQINRIKEWSNGGTRNNYTVMKIYECPDSYADWKKCVGIFLLPEIDNLPEDISFYKGNTIWIATVSHEKLAFLYNPSESDLEFLKKRGIKYYYTAPMNVYKLPFEYNFK